MVCASLTALTLPACYNEALERQAEQIRRQQDEIARQRRELEGLKCIERLEDEYTKAKFSGDPRALSSFRDHVKQCPDSEDVHLRLGVVLAENGLDREAEEEFEAVLRMNPNSIVATRRLEDLRRRK
jgi:Tfp pilus assembly protein PilF